MAKKTRIQTLFQQSRKRSGKHYNKSHKWPKFPPQSRDSIIANFEKQKLTHNAKDGELY